jgi:FlaA1/EpsC-like NDP-sugar epimerase
MADNAKKIEQSEISESWQISRQLKIILAHFVLFTLALFISFAVDSKMKISETWFPSVFLAWLAVTLFVKFIVFGILHQYRGWWRYASVTDLFNIMVCSHISTLVLLAGWFIAYNIAGIRERMGVLTQVPQAVMVLDWAASIIVICGVRLAIRLYYEETRVKTNRGVKRILIVGAGNAGESLLREIHRNPEAEYDVAGFVDDDRNKRGVRIHGIPVLGSTLEIKAISVKRNVDEIVIAMPSASHKELRRVVEQCQGANLQFSIIPDLVAIASGQVSVSQMREVDINDLLGRDPITLELGQIQEFVKSKVVMITGAGGSIGSEMCRQVGPFRPKKLLVVDQTENGLFFVERELRQRFPDLEITAHICDIADKNRVDYLFDLYHPEVVIHAAAHKHVPLMENNPGEAIKNNVIGTRNIARAADRVGTDNFVMISTDKAVNPTSVMGSSKRIAEMVIQCLNETSETEYVTVRFGNVLGSNGSVIPIFREQIERGGPVTVTHPDMMRYFMTIPEASQLVLQAATMGRNGEIFVLDMGEPVKIVDLARDLITLSGFRPGEDIEIQFSGMRPGEKLFEELAITGEDMQPTRHPKISIWTNKPTDQAKLNHAIEELQDIIDQDNDYDGIVRTIKSIVPEYVGDVDSMQLRDSHLAQQAQANGVVNAPAKEE